MIQQQGRFRGRVVKYDVTKSFGFVSIEECKEVTENFFDRDSIKIKEFKGNDAFIYYSDIEPEVNDFKKLIKDQVVEFDLYRGKRGFVAKNMKIIGDYYDKSGNIAFFDDKEAFNR